MLRYLWIILVLAASPANAVPANVVRQDFFVSEENGIRISVRQVMAKQAPRDAPALLLIHGARVPGIASFDLDVPGESLAADLATRGLAVYVMDVRGYGASTRPKEMQEPAAGRAALVRSNEAARDIGSVVDRIRARRRVRKVGLFGWATGGKWAGYYASLFPDKVNALIMLNSLYGGSSEHPLMGHRSDMEDPSHPVHFDPSACGSYRLNEEKSLFGVWDRSIPVESKNDWRDPAVARACAAAASHSDPTSSTRTPQSFRSPCGAMEDSLSLSLSLSLATGRQLWDAS